MIGYIITVDQSEKIKGIFVDEVGYINPVADINEILFITEKEKNKAESLLGIILEKSEFKPPFYYKK